MKYAFPLRLSIPLLIFLAGCVILAGAWVLEYRALQRHAENLGSGQLKITASFIGAEVEAALRNRNPAEARAAVERAMSNPVVERIDFADPQGTVLFSSHPSAVGRSREQLAPVQKLISALPDQSPTGDMATTRLNGGARLGGRFPLRMPISPEQMLATRVGNLYLVVDVSGELARQQEALAGRMLTWVGLLLLLALGFWWLLRSLLLRRIDKLIHSVRAVGKGDFTQVPSVGGSDELGTLGRELGVMAARLRDHSEKLAYLSDHDALTGLLNRHGFEAELGRSLRAVRRRGSRQVLALFDIDSLRVINDTQGHQAGDELLQLIAQLLRDALPDAVAAARVGGDEFALLVDLPPAESVESIARRLQAEMLSLRFEYGGERFGIQVSIGLVELASSVESAADALGYADAACYEAKDRGRGSYYVGDVDRVSSERMRGDMKWVSRIQSALDADRLRLFAQRIVPAAASGSASDLRFEVLVRMLDERGQILPPGAFLEAAERYNMVQRIDRWVVGRTLDWLQDDRRMRGRVASCSVNLSGMSLGDEHILECVDTWARHSGMDPSVLCFEVTETAAIRNLSQARWFVDRLRELGCRMALDDFGTGLSSFAYLKGLPVDLIKIDGTFVRDMLDDPVDRAVVTAINDIAHEVGMRTVAEFVEDDATLQALCEIGVDFAQGYGIAVPLPLDELITEHAGAVRALGGYFEK